MGYEMTVCSVYQAIHSLLHETLKLNWSYLKEWVSDGGLMPCRQRKRIISVQIRGILKPFYSELLLLQVCVFYHIYVFFYIKRKKCFISRFTCFFYGTWEWNSWYRKHQQYVMWYMDQICNMSKKATFFLKTVKKRQLNYHFVAVSYNYHMLEVQHSFHTNEYKYIYKKKRNLNVSYS